jgi:ornithine cyclodeaminase/alanine dehydrogenase-like protein (mu-crystallin family)
MKLGKEILFLSENDVKACIDVKKAIELCEEGERLTGLGKASDDKFYLPIKGKLVFKPFAGYIQGGDIVAAKIFTLAPDNPQKNLIASNSIGLIYDAETLMPLAILEASWLTGIKVGASSAVAAKYLAKKSSSIIGMIGAGLQGRTHLEALQEIFKIQKVRVASRTKESRELYAKEMTSKLNISIEPVYSVESAVKDADIVVTATTADAPLVKKEWFEPGMLIMKLGSYQELDPHIITTADKFVVDKWDYVSHRVKEIIQLLNEHAISHENVYAEIPEIVAKKKSGRENDDERIVYIALGLGGDYVALFDYIYKRATKLGVGKTLKLVE